MAKHNLLKLNLEHGLAFASKAGDFVEQSIGNAIDNSALKAQILPEEPKDKTWYRVPLAKGLSGDGSEYYIYVKIADPDKLCIFLSGGGVAWNEYTAARPVTGGAVASKAPNFYWNNLRPFTQIMNINVGITDNISNANPFRDWSFVVITYATGDFHVGNNDFTYQAEDGSEQVLHFHGKVNFEESMKIARKLFDHPKQLLIAGNSAGAFAVPALTPEILSTYYPDNHDVTLLSDSGLLLYKGWHKCAKKIWNADERVYKAIHTDNITLDWYKALIKDYGDRIRPLYASSTRDYLLSAYYNDIMNHKYETDADVQQQFYEQLCVMVEELQALHPEFRFFINDWKLPLVTQGGTVHTSVREFYFTVMKMNGISMAEWLHDAVMQKNYNVGMSLLT
ncbi:MAG: pectin acetylesterase [Lachnospiraceae bacterium]|nr:pectin acetylesterase [Lachnospiraceae bacterium]